MEEYEKMSIVTWIVRSKYRYKVVVNLILNEVMTPSELSNCTNIRVAHISKVLKDLKEYNIVECVNPNMRKGKLYKLTDDGRELLDNWRLNHLVK